MTDEEVQAAGRHLLVLALRSAEETFRHGTPQAKAALTNTFLRDVAKALGSRADDEMKEEMRDMMAQFAKEQGL